MSNEPKKSLVTEQVEAALKTAAAVTKNLPAQLREADVLMLTMMELMKRYCTSAVAAPGAPPPQLMVIAKALEAAFTFADLTKVPRGMVFDLQFQMLFEREAVRAAEQQAAPPLIIP